MHTYRFSPVHPRVGVLATFTVLIGLLVFAAPALGVNPPGNNGTVKIDGQPWDIHPNNEPHPGCVFQVDFYGFDEGDLWADVIFTGHPPTGPMTTLLEDRVFIGEDDNRGGGSEAGLDAEAGTLEDADGHGYYDLSAALSGVAPHAQQGYHVKLTVHADGSQGADTKHKVFWVEACEAPAGETEAGSNQGGTQPGGGELGGTQGTEAGQAGTAAAGGVQGGRGKGMVAPGGGSLPDTATEAPTRPGQALVMLAVVVALSGALAATLLREGARLR